MIVFRFRIVAVRFSLAERLFVCCTKCSVYGACVLSDFSLSGILIEAGASASALFYCFTRAQKLSLAWAASFLLLKSQDKALSNTIQYDRYFVVVVIYCIWLKVFFSAFALFVRAIRFRSLSRFNCVSDKHPRRPQYRQYHRYWQLLAPISKRSSNV